MAQRLAHLENLEARVLLATMPVITEFQAVNSTTLQDSDGDYSDWIEITNESPTERLPLGGWYLTDDNTDLRKWQLPNVELEPDSRLLVFASGKDRVDPTKELHTNFRLDAGGEYLALIKPDGLSVQQEFSPQYPPQLADQSYGLALQRDTTVLVSNSTDVKAFVPVDDSLSQSWTQPEFDDSSWLSGTGAVGFEQPVSGFSIRENFDAALGPEWTVDVPSEGSATAAVEGGKLNLTAPADHDTKPGRGLAPIVYRDLPGAPADWEFSTSVNKPAAGQGSVGIAIYDAASGRGVIAVEYSANTQFQMTVNGATVGRVRRSTNKTDFFFRIVRDGFADTWTGYYKINEGDTWVQLASIQEGVEVPHLGDPRPGLVARSTANDTTASFEFAELVAPDQRPVYGPQIGLNVQSAMLNNNSSIYVRIPFTVEGDLARFDELDLNINYDDGFIAYINGVEVASRNVPVPNLVTWNSQASGTHGAVGAEIPVQQINLETFRHTLRSGRNILALHGMNVTPDDGDFFLKPTLHAAKVLSVSPQGFLTPTPGARNMLPGAPMPRISDDGGAFFDSTVVSIQHDPSVPQGSNLQIRYTLDGTEPTEESPLYTEPITLTSSAWLRARTFDPSPQPNFLPSNIAAAPVMIVSSELKGRDSEVPLVIIDMLGQTLPGTNSRDLASALVVIYDVDPATGKATLVEGIENYVGRGGVRDRGSSTAGQQKPNMAFEIWGPTNEDLDDFDAPLLGMPADSDWVLHAPWTFDPALIRNQFAFDLSNQVGRYAPRTRDVEVYLARCTRANCQRSGAVTETDYAGVYSLMEKIKQGPDRVNVADITPDDNREPEITGGYIWKVDRNDPQEQPFSAGGQSLNWVYPKSDRDQLAPLDQRVTADQVRWVQNYFNEFQRVLRSPDFADPVNGYAKYVDVDSAIDHHLLNVLTFNVDAFRLSGYFFKDRDKPFEYGPIWDFDRSMGSTDGRDLDTEVWRSRVGDLGTDFFGYPWYREMFRDPNFWQKYVDRYQELRRGPFSDENLSATVDRLAEPLREAQARNFQKWRSIRPRFGGWQGEIDFLKQWLHDRAAFMDANFTKPPAFLIAGEVVDARNQGQLVTPGSQISILPPAPRDFADLPLVSGEPGAATGRYLVPSDDSLGRTWTELAFDDSSWSSGALGFGFENTTSRFDPFIKTRIKPTEVVPDAVGLYTRIKFQVSDVRAINQLVLKLRYDDGFVAYINGVEVARRNSRDTDPTFSTRGSSRRDTDAIEFEDITIQDFQSVLRPGDNVLAIHVLNTSTSDSNMLLLPELANRVPDVRPSETGTIYYTSDGSDPRASDGQPSGQARILRAGETLTINRNTRVIARNLDPAPRHPESRIVLTDWSGPVTFDFIVQPQSDLAITEINYNPAAPTEAERQAMPGVGNDDFEFLEIRNVGSTTQDLTGVKLTDGVEFDFATSAVQSLAPGNYAVVVRDREAFQLRYGPSVPIAGQYKGNLSNASEDIDLRNGLNQILFSVNYRDSDPWSARADGVGATLELVDHFGTLKENQSKYYSWQGSFVAGGTPGTDNSRSSGVVINEVLSNPTRNGVDSIELYNASDVPIVIGGWFLSDTANNLFKYQIRAGLQLGPNQYQVFTEDDFNRAGDANGFALSGSRGDNLWLVTRNAAGGVGQFIDDVHFEAAFPGESFGRTPNGSGRLAPMLLTTFGQPNAAPRVGPLVVNEINYDPGEPSDAAKLIYPPMSPTDLEFIEIHNPTTSEVKLEHWKLRGGVDYDFDPVALGPGKSLIVVGFSPARPDNTRRLAAFRAHYGIDESVMIVGGYQGQLNNADDRISLRRPGTPPANEPNFIPSLIEDEVLYDDQTPWPTGADSTGRSIHRRDVTLYGNDGTSWIAANPTPGSLGFSITTDGDFNGDGSVNIADIDLMWPELRAANPDLRFDLTGDGKVNAADRDRLILETLNTTYGDSNLDGRFDTGDFVAVFKRGEYEDKIPLNSTWSDGDWDGNGDFDTADLVLAFRTGGYELAQAVAAANSASDSGQRSVLVGAVTGARVRSNVAGESVLPRDHPQADDLPARSTTRRPLGVLAARDQIFRDTDRWLDTSLRGLVGRPGAGSFNREPEEAAAKQLSTRVRFP